MEPGLQITPEPKSATVDTSVEYQRGRLEAFEECYLAMCEMRECLNSRCVCGDCLLDVVVKLKLGSDWQRCMDQKPKLVKLDIVNNVKDAT